jgi:periplasmic copper chaperone A
MERWIMKKQIALVVLTAGLLSSCGPQTSEPKSDAAAMPTPTVSGGATEMPAGTQMASLSMINAKMKKPVGDRPTSAYLTIENGAPTPERLISAASPDFAKVELHDTKKEGDMMKMITLDGIDVAPNSQTVFEPGGKHISLSGAKRPLNNGDSVKVTLTFSNSGPIETNFVVLGEIPRPDGAMGKMDDHKGH